MTHKVKCKVGPFEFEAEGTQNFVSERFLEWKQSILANKDIWIALAVNGTVNRPSPDVKEPGRRAE